VSGAVEGTRLAVGDLPGLAARRFRGRYVVDPWGADHDWIDLVGLATRLVVRPSAEGLERIPDGPAVLVANRRLGIGEALALALAVRRSSGRLLRLVGAPDVAPFGPMLRRVGGVLADAREVRSLLHAGEIVGVPLSPQARVQRAGTIRPELLVPAIELSVPVVPVAIVGGELTGSWRIAIGHPVEAPPARRRRSLAAAELADRARAGVQVLLDDAFPARWSLG
jgi:1-acyl-sn-glycerol-3-phosphate acyltransferase